MPLENLPAPAAEPVDIPRPVALFLREAGLRIEQFTWERNFAGFVPSDFPTVYSALKSLDASGLLPGRWFCEWGSGFGVNACLAAMLEFDSWGIEVEGELVQEARKLAEEFGIAAEFVQGSFIPAGADGFARAAGGCSWMAGVAGGGHEALGLTVEDFDLIFAYPWPDEEGLTAALFERYAREGALLLTYHEVGGLRLRRKIV